LRATEEASCAVAEAREARDVIAFGLALDARIDDRGRLVAETTVRRIATSLGLNKDTVTKYLGRFREHAFVLQEESCEVASGRYYS
jgi:predicted transcriptional regulator